jgi:hypothetical protein
MGSLVRILLIALFVVLAFTSAQLPQPAGGDPQHVLRLKTHTPLLLHSALDKLHYDVLSPKDTHVDVIVSTTELMQLVEFSKQNQLLISDAKVVQTRVRFTT